MSYAVISGSFRAGSCNSAIVRKIVEIGIVRQRVMFPIDLSDVPMYNQDLENAYVNNKYPPNVDAIRDIVARCDNVVLVTPEHNSMPSAAMKNIFDWLSRGGSQGSPLAKKNIYILSAAGMGQGSFARAVLWQALNNLNTYQGFDMTLMKDESFGVNLFNGDVYVKDGVVVHTNLITMLENTLFK